QVGLANLKLGYVGRAAEAYGKAMDLYEQLGSAQALAAAALNRGTALLLCRNNDQAAAAFARAADLWQGLNNQEELERCRLGGAGPGRDARLAALAEAGHAQTDLDKRREAPREMLTL